MSQFPVSLCLQQTFNLAHVRLDPNSADNRAILSDGALRPKKGVSRAIMRERMHTGLILTMGSAEDDTPYRCLPNRGVALFVSNFPSRRPAPDPYASLPIWPIVIAVIVIVMQPGIMHNASVRVQRIESRLAAVQHHVRVHFAN